LIWEISEVLEETKEEAEGQLDQALEVCKEEQAPVSTNCLTLPW
jgi:hypothetical protein